MKFLTPVCRLLALSGLLLVATPAATWADASTPSPIRPSSANPWYWEYHGEPIVLIGGSHRDNLFQWTGQQLVDHLELLLSVGGNYLRNTLSDRNPGDIYAFRQTADKRYDLEQWNAEYWDRLAFFLAETHRRGIIIQVTLWDQFDLSDDNWNRHPWGPAQNVNYGPEVLDSKAEFFGAVENRNEALLAYQRRFVDEVTRHTFPYDHVLYNINNESLEGEVWEIYWARYLRKAADAAGKKISITTLQFDPSNAVRSVMTHRDVYDFIDISQNNQDSRGGRGPAHWDNILFWRAKIANMPGGPVPMNNEKVYGGGDGYTNWASGTTREAEARMWRNLIAGCAATRFHRDAVDWGSGLTERPQITLRAMRTFLDAYDIIDSSPQNDLIRQRGPAPGAMEAYVTAKIGERYAVYFPAGRYTVDLDPWVYVDRLRLRWLDIETATWSEPEIVEVEWEGGQEAWGDRGRVRLESPRTAVVAVLEVID